MNSTGYGPSLKNRLIFSGEEDKYELWEVRFMGHLRGLNLWKVAEGTETDEEKNAKVYSELVQMLDDKSLSLIIRDAKNKGKEALKILRDHYIGTSECRVISLYTELTSLKLGSEETITEYVIRAETAKTSLLNADETVSDRLLIAMILKGLPDSYKQFSTVVSHKDKPMSLGEFKSALRSFEESERSRELPNAVGENIMKCFNDNNSNSKLKCFGCGKIGHKKYQCKIRKTTNYKNRWCINCKSNTHDTNYCRKNDINFVSDKSENSSHSFVFKVNSNDENYLLDSEDYGNLLVDCGATSHIVCDRSKYVDLDPNFNSKSHFIELADGSRTNGVVKGKGDAIFTVIDECGTLFKIKMCDALYIPSYSQNIFSVRSAISKGASVKFSPCNSQLLAPDGTVFDIHNKNKLYYLDSVKVSKYSHSLREWHKILGHCNVQDISKLEAVAKDMKITDNKNFDCSVCLEGKMTESRSRIPDVKAAKVFDFVHCDLTGKIDPVTKEKFAYAISFVDDFSGMIMLYLLKNKTDVIGATKKFFADMAPYGTIKRLRCDNGTEFTSKEFRNLLTDNRIKQEFSAPYSPHQNGTVERSWRSIFEMARCLLLEGNVPKDMWHYAVKMAAHIRNRCFNSRIGMTPYEAVTKKQPTMGNMHIFGSACYAYINIKKKLDRRSEKGYFVGYDSESPAYLIYFPDRNLVQKRRLVHFYTEKMVTADLDCEIIEYPTSEPETVEPSQNNSEHSPDRDESGKNVTNEIPTIQETPQVQVHSRTEKRYPQRERKPPKYLDDYVADPDISSVIKYSIDHCCRVSDIPATYMEAINSPDVDQWKCAMNDEMSALIDNETFEEKVPPVDCNVIGGKWVYSVKAGQNGEERFKARYVARGFSQVKNLDYQETFSPTAKMTTIRMMLKVAVQFNYVIEQMDVKTAYLNAEVDRELYMRPPEGYPSKLSEDHVWKLKKSLYGLKQSGRLWNKVLHDFLTDQNFNQCLSDPCLYRKDMQNSFILILVWVDDILVCGQNITEISTIKCSLHNRFKMRDLGQINWFLGIKFNSSENSISATQETYIDKLLCKFNMADCSTKLVPCDANIYNIETAESKILTDVNFYRQIVGSLIYIMTCTRPDICFSVTKLSENLISPTKAHLTYAKNVLRYLKHTKAYSLNFHKSCTPLKLSGFTDSDWASSKDRKSISGYAFMLDEDGPLISWRSKKQSTIALSSCEAEYIAATAAVQEAKFLRSLLSEMRGSSPDQVTIFADNQGAIKLAYNPVFHARSKHIDIKFHFVREEINKGSIQLVFVPSADNIADIFTKPLSKFQLVNFECIFGNN